MAGSTGWVQISAFVVCLAAWCITGREPIGDLFRVKPWYLLLGGAIGAFITITVIWVWQGSTGEGGDADRHFPARSGVAD